MAKFINTRKAVSEIEDLIRNAGENLFLISPYLKLSKDFRQLLEYRNSKNKITTVIFGKQELKPDEMRFLQGLRWVLLKFNEDLHAKCYANDDKMIITSLNLYEFSMANNKEMGVLIDRTDQADEQTFKDAMAEIEFIQATSQVFDLAAPKADQAPKVIETSAKAAPKVAERASSAKATGYCIRTGAEIPFNIDRPFTYDAYKRWSQYKDAEYAEKYCHFSGEPSHGETSLSRPILKKNWKKAQDAHGMK